MLHKAVVGLAILLFVAYCVSAYRHQYRVDVPRYVTAEVNLLRGQAIKRWDDRNFRSTHLAALYAKRYQVPAGGSLKLPNGETLAAGTVLKNEHYAAIIDDARARTAPALVTLDNPAAISGLEGKKYTFRDPVKDPATGEYLFRGGEAIDQAAINKLIAAGVTSVGVQGSPSPVKLELGTMLATLVIFLALVCAMKLTLVDPLLSLMQQRERLIDGGVDQAKQNVRELERFRKERSDGLATVARSRLVKVTEGRQASLKESETIVHTAKEEERRLRHESLAALQTAMDEARREALGEARGLARLAVAQVLGRSPEEKS